MHASDDSSDDLKVKEDARVRRDNLVKHHCRVGNSLCVHYEGVVSFRYCVLRLMVYR